MEAAVILIVVMESIMESNQCIGERLRTAGSLSSTCVLRSSHATNIHPGVDRATRMHLPHPRKYACNCYCRLLAHVYRDLEHHV